MTITILLEREAERYRGRQDFDRSNFELTARCVVEPITCRTEPSSTVNDFQTNMFGVTCDVNMPEC